MPASPHHTRKRGRRRGLTLIEAALVLGILAITMGSVAQFLSDTAETQRSKQAGDRMAEILQASQQYMRANQTVLTGLTKTANVSVGVAMTAPGGGDPGASGSGLTSLQGGGFLPSTYVDVDAYGQSHRLVIKQVAPGTTNAHLEGMVVSQGGMNIPDRQIGRVARFVGEQGGFMAATPVNASAAGQITGVAGGWITPAANWTAPSVTPTTGHVMASLSINDNALAGDYLNRYNIGVPEANTMHTDVHFGGNKIDSISQICANGSATCVNDGSVLNIGPNITIPGYLHAGEEVTAGTTMTANGTIQSNYGNIVAANGLVGAQTGIYTNTGDIHAYSGNVDAGVDVNANRNVNALSGGVYANTDVAAQHGVVYGNQGVVAQNGNVWAQTGAVYGNQGVIAQNGDVTAQNGNVVSAYDVAAGRDIYTNNGRLSISNAAGDEQSYIQDLSTGALNLDTVVYSDLANSDGSQNHSLQRGNGVRLSDLLPHYVGDTEYIVTEDSPFIPMPTCNGGGIPKVNLSVLQDSMTFMSSLLYSYVPGGQVIGQAAGNIGVYGSGCNQNGCIGVYSSQYNSTPVYSGPYGLVSGVRPGRDYIGRQVSATPVGRMWQMVVSGTRRSDLPVTAAAQTFCWYN